MIDNLENMPEKSFYRLMDFLDNEENHIIYVEIGTLSSELIRVGLEL